MALGALAFVPLGIGAPQFESPSEVIRTFQEKTAQPESGTVEGVPVTRRHRYRLSLSFRASPASFLWRISAGLFWSLSWSFVTWP